MKPFILIFSAVFLIFGSLLVPQPAKAIVIAPIVAITALKLAVFLVGLLSVPLTALFQLFTTHKRLRSFLISTLILILLFLASYFIFNLLSKPVTSSPNLKVSFSADMVSPSLGARSMPIIDYHPPITYIQSFIISFTILSLPAAVLIWLFFMNFPRPWSLTRKFTLWFLTNTSLAIVLSIFLYAVKNLITG